MALVIKSWFANDVPDESNNYVSIYARQAGLLSWFLAFIGINPTVKFNVSSNKIIVEIGSLSGMTYKTIPISQISSTFCAYSKPWLLALILCILGVMTIISGKAFFGFLFVGAGFLVYYLHKTLTLSVTEVSGEVTRLGFQPSIIENQSIGEDQARHVILIINRLVESKLNNSQESISETNLVKSCENCGEKLELASNFCKACGAESD